MAFCIKNYRRPKGLSAEIHKENQGTSARFEIKGPMGHGLKVKKSGIHVVFAAGTGVLCFVDLVAAMIQDKLLLNGNGTNGSRDFGNGSIIGSGRNIITKQQQKRSIVGVGDSFTKDSPSSRSPSRS